MLIIGLMFLNIAAANVRTAKVESKNLFESATPIEIGKNYAGEICKEDQGISYVIQRKAGMELIVKGTCIHPEKLVLLCICIMKTEKN